MSQSSSKVSRNEFCPGPLGAITSPFYIARHGLHKELKKLLPSCQGQLLDVGCGTKPYLHLASSCTNYIGLEIDTPEAHKRGGASLYYDGSSFPLADSSCDSVFCSQVFEHVFTPEAFLSEIRRVLKPGGQLLMTVPFLWDEHEQPFDYARYSSFGLRSAVEKAGFSVIEQNKTWMGPPALAQLAAAYIYKLTRRLPRLFRGLIQILLIAPITLGGILSSWILPKNPDLYLDNILLAKRTHSHE